MAEAANPPQHVTLFLAGDVMTGRGIDQALPHPGDARLYEPGVKSAVEYLALAEAANGPIPIPVDFAYVWGDALAELARRAPDARIVNLEAAVTAGGYPAPKGINYRMNPSNLPVLAAARLDCCVLANNHVLDWACEGLIETLAVLQGAGFRTAGAGRSLAEASSPAVLPRRDGGRILVFGFGAVTSGIPRGWAAATDRPGIDLLPDLSPRTLQRVARQIGAVRQAGDVVVASIHWGGNWGYEVPGAQRRFARGLVDEAGVDVVHGHSSHHAKGIEVHRDRPILYGCGDFLNDYEGISGLEAFRSDLALMYFPTIDAASHRLVRLEMVPLRIRNFRLNRATAHDSAWLRHVLVREGRKLGTSVRQGGDFSLALEWG